MSNQVTTRTYSWADLVAQAKAQDALETAGMPFPEDQRTWVYEFSNGVRKVERANPYTS